MEKKIKVIESPELSTRYEKRYIVVDEETGEVLDNAQGYGYKSIRNAHAAYSYKNRDKSKDKERQAKKKRIQKWLKEHKEFNEAMDIAALDSAKGCEPFNAVLVKKMLKDFNLEPDFTASELLKVWKEQN